MKREMTVKAALAAYQRAGRRTLIAWKRWRRACDAEYPAYSNLYEAQKRAREKKGASHDCPLAALKGEKEANK